MKHKHERFALGAESTAGWLVMDSRNMSAGYVAANSEEAAQAYVDYRNLIDGIRLQQLRDEAAAKVAFITTLERISRAA